MKRSKVLLIAISFGLLMPIPAFTAGGPESDASKSDHVSVEGLPLTRDRITVDYYMLNHKTKPFTADDLTIAELQKRTNVYFNIISIDSGYWDKYKVMLASSDLPDLVYTTVADAKRYGMDGPFVPLDDLLREHGEFIMNAAEQEKIEEDMRALDGNIYFFPKIALQPPEPFMVRQDWLDVYDLDPPDTLDEMYQMLKTFKEQDPAGDGQTIPFASLMYADPSICYLNSFYRAFGVDQDFLLKENRMVWGPAQPGMRDAMSYLHRLYAEGLLDNEAPVLAKKQWEERVSSGRVGMILYAPVRTDYFTNILRKANPRAEMVGIKPPIGIDGKRHTPPLPRFTPTYCMAVTEDSVHGEIITKFFNYVFSPEGRMIVSYGVEGDSYVLKDGKPVFTEKMYTQEGAGNMFGKSAIGGRRLASWPYDEAILQMYKGTLALQAIDLARPYFDKPTPMLNFDGDELMVIESSYNDLKDTTYQFLLKFLVGELSAINEWDDYIAELRRNGLDELQSAYNNAYARRYK